MEFSTVAIKCTELDRLRLSARTGYVVLDPRGAAVDRDAVALTLLGVGGDVGAATREQLAQLSAALARLTPPWREAGAAVGALPRLNVSAVPVECSCDPHRHHLLLLVSEVGEVGCEPVSAQGVELQRARLHLSEALRMARLGRWEVDVETGGATVSPELLALLAQPHGKVETLEALLALAHPEDASRLRDALALASRGEEPVTHTRFLRPQRSPLETKVWLMARPEADGRVRQLVGVAQDVSEQAQLTAKLQLTERLASMGTLAAGVAHEINNPLAFVIANLNVVSNELAAVPAIPGVDLEGVRDAVNEAADGAERVRQIVSDLKTFTRSNERHQGPIDVRRIVQATLNMARNETKHRAQVVTDLGEVALVLGNEARLGQVFLNLVINAAQAIPDGRAAQNRITVTTRMEGGQVLVLVEDTGAGIEPAALQRIFDPYYTTKKLGEGTGLGLFISLGIVRELGGTLVARSERGRGSAFEVRLPVAPRDQYSSRPSPVPSSARARVLFIDDEPNILRAMERLLRKHHELTLAHSGRDALGLLDAGKRFDVIFCDIMMPDVSGLDVWERLDDSLREAVVFMTGGGFSERASEFLQRVKPPLLMKPVSLATLLKVIARRSPAP